MNLAFTLAVGDKKYAQLALNWCLSVKAAHPKAKTALIYQASTTADIQHYIDEHFDYGLRLPDSDVGDNPIEGAFRLKTQLYDLVTSIVDAEAYLFMDADTIMLSGRSIDEFFTELKDVDFTMWCNDVYDFATKKRMRDDYTFWCEPEEMFDVLKTMDRDTDKMPQVNSSFIYFKKSEKIKQLFKGSQAVWKFDFDNFKLAYKKYKGAMPDELCFNIACASLAILPHQIPYYPIFFSFASEHFEEQYIRSWKAIGFAGDTKQQEGVVHLYNHNVAYFREYFDVEEKFVEALPKEKIPKDRHPLVIEPTSKRTIYRRDEVVNSAGGIFNPDGIYIKDFGYITIFRKEANMDFYKVGHNQATAIPHLQILTKDRYESFELEYVNKPKDIRFEDFRIVGNSKLGNTILVSHTVIEKNLTPRMTAKIGVSIINIDDRTFIFGKTLSLPVEETKIEKNWTLFQEYDSNGNRVFWCVYSLSPYRLFCFDSEFDKVNEISVFQPELDWFHNNQRICNSTRPVLIGNDYLMLFHSRESGIYFQGAVIIDKATKDISHYTKRSIPIKNYSEGFQPGLIYVSGILYVEERNLLRIFFGEADSHSCSNDYNADEFVAMVKQNAVYESNNNSVLELLKQTV